MSQLHEKGMFSAELLKEIRSKFLYVDWDPYSGQRVFLEAASGSLRPQSVVEAVAKETALPDQHGRANPGSKHADAVFRKGVEDLKLFFGAKSGQVMPALTGTDGIFRIVNAIILNVPGTNVVTTELEHPSVFGSTRYFGEMTGKEWRVAKLSRETGSVDTESILEKIDKNTCLLGLIHASNITGAIVDVGLIIKEARKINPDIYVLIDGVQYAPHAPIDVEEIQADAYVFSPYKVYCVKGIGFAYLSERLAKLPHWKLPGKPETDWVLGAAEHQTYAAWSAAVDYISWVGSHFTNSANRRTQIVAGMEAIRDQVVALLHRTLHGTREIDGLLKMKHVDLCGMGNEISKRVCLVSLNLKGMDSAKGVELYKREHIRVHNRVQDAYSKHVLEAFGMPEVIRMSACHYNTPEEIDLFLKATAQFA